MKYQLVKIKPDEIEEVHEILRLCGLEMKDKFNLGHWNPPYPVHLMQKDAKESYVYAVKEQNKTLATFTISKKPLDYYYKNIWLNPDHEAIYVSHLAVLPKFQGRGIGSWCMRTIEDFAREWGCAAVRLDAYEKYPLLLEFYVKLGYQQRQTVTYQRLRLICLEKILR
ncbi:GNAT family N-acetyltransferase [[Eubacterium] cellulosolvens]